MNNARLHSLHVSRTYQGWLAGAPSPVEAIDTARCLAEDLYPGWPVVVIPAPTIIENRGLYDYELLPEWRYIAMIHADRLQEGDGSALVVVWFSYQCFEDKLGIVLSRVDWEANAIDYEV